MGSFSEDFAILSATAVLMMLMNRDLGRRVTWSLSLVFLLMRSGLLDRASGLASSFPGTWTSFRS